MKMFVFFFNEISSSEDTDILSSDGDVEVLSEEIIA